jgi:mRNA-degrading endonuclease RelE of RelBE toxin-antitoxin system
MTNEVYVSQAFKREAKSLVKKYKTLPGSIDRLIDELKLNPYLGDNYGAGIFKVRLIDRSKGGGKSGGFRVMYYHLTIKDGNIDILLLSIFNKSEKSTIKKSEALKMLNAILAEFEGK